MEQHFPQFNSEDNSAFSIARLQKLQNSISLGNSKSKQKLVRSINHQFQKQKVHFSAQSAHD